MFYSNPTYLQVFITPEVPLVMSCETVTNDIILKIIILSENNNNSCGGSDMRIRIGISWINSSDIQKGRWLMSSGGIV